MDSGGNGANPASLTAAEFDGYVWLDDTATADDDASPLHVPWQVLPRAAGDVALSDESVEPGGTVEATNSAVNDTTVEFYSLLATSEDDPDSGAGDALADVDFRAMQRQTFPSRRTSARRTRRSCWRWP